MKKKIAYLNNKIGDIAHKFSIQNKLKLMGSNSLRGILFPSDYDFVSKITEPMKALSIHLQELFSKPLPFLFLDFKAGTDPTKLDGKLRWTIDDLSKGYVIIHNEKKTLEDALKENMLIKLDYAVPIGNSFFENSIIFITRFQTQKTKKQIEKELDEDITIYTKKENSMKALKRLYSLLLLQKTNEPLQQKLLHFFNSDVGLANKIANDLELLLLILEKHDLPFKQIIDTTQMIKERLASIPWVNHLQLINTMTKRNSKKIIEKEINYLRNKINPLAKAFLRANMK
jgi:hypothetical protein